MDPLEASFREAAYAHVVVEAFQAFLLSLEEDLLVALDLCVLEAFEISCQVAAENVLVHPEAL